MITDLLTPAGNMIHEPAQPIRCMIVDDEQHAIDLLSNYIEHTPALRLSAASTRATEILTLAEKEPVDLLFLDVEMPLLTGFDLVNILKGKCSFVLCSGHREYALKGFEHDVCDYLLKPVTYSRFLKAIEKVKQRTAFVPPLPVKEEPRKDYIFLKGDRKHRYIRIRLNEIEYIKSAGHYIHITLNGERMMILSSMSEILQRLPQDQFVRVHHSFIVPLGRITYVDQEILGLVNMPAPIPLGDKYRPALMKLLKKNSYR